MAANRRIDSGGFETASVVVLISAVVAFASVVLALNASALWSSVTGGKGDLASVMVLAAVLALVAVPLYGRGSYDYSGAAVIAAGLAYGVGAAMLTAVVATAVHYARMPGKAHRALFTAATLALAGAAATAPSVVLHAERLQLPLRLTCAALGALLYCVVNVSLLSVAMGLTEGRSPLAIWRERFRWMTPYYVIAGPLALALVIANERLGAIGLYAFAAPPLFMMLSVRQYIDRTRDAVEEVRAANARLAQQNVDLQRLTQRLRRTHLSTIAALSRSMEAKDFYTGGHTERVARIALGLARRLGYAGDDLAAIEIGGVLHDIGKIGVPESILRKPDALDEQEWAVMREHPLVSDRILMELDLPPIVRQIARSSHERIDGDGYPDGLSGDEIPLPARIIHVADAFDALTSDRPYRRRRPTLVALEEIRVHAGTQFCPQVVDALERLYVEEPQILTAGYLAAVA